MSGEGFAVDLAGDATGGEERAYLEDYDVLVVDVMLPEGDGAGFDLAQRLRRGGYKVPILFLTARVDMDSKVSGAGLGLALVLHVTRQHGGQHHAEYAQHGGWGVKLVFGAGRRP